MTRPTDPSTGIPAALGAALQRRTLLKGAAGIGAGIAGLQAGSVLAAPTGRGSSHLLSRIQAAADAAPPEKQIFIVPSDITTTSVLDFYEAVYKRPNTAADLWSDPLVRVDKDFNVVPGAALEWGVGDDGLTWTFNLDPTLVWSDGNPVVANDWVQTFRYGADPAHAWDFTWFFLGVIDGWDQAVAGEIPLDQLGVTQGADANTLIVKTQKPAPYLPAMLLYSCPLSAVGLAGPGPLYNSDPATAISSGPFILGEWLTDQQITYIRNESYKGSLKVDVQKVIVKLASLDTHFTMYQDDEVDYMEGLAPAEQQIALAEFPDDVKSSVGDFRTFYLYFDTTKAPFDDIKVRQAFSHAIDRDLLATQVLGPEGSPAYSWLAPGFPASQREAMSGIQNFDPAAGQALLAEAGFPGGEGFPAQQMWLRAPRPLDKTVAAALASMLTEHLGIEIELLEKDQTGYMAALTAKPTEILFGYVSYGMDFLDPTNMLGVWLSGGRHSWVNEDFDAKVNEAASFLGATEERITIFQDAERILVEDVPGVFVYHETPLQLIKPWVSGDALAPDANGNASMHFPRYTTMSTVPGGLYITTDAPDTRSV